MDERWLLELDWLLVLSRFCCLCGSFTFFYGFLGDGARFRFGLIVVEFAGGSTTCFISLPFFVCCLDLKEQFPDSGYFFQIGCLDLRRWILDLDSLFVGSSSRIVRLYKERQFSIGRGTHRVLLSGS